MVSKIFDTYDIQCTYNELNEKFKRDYGAVFTSSYFFLESKNLHKNVIKFLLLSHTAKTKR